MSTLTLERQKQKSSITVLEDYDVAADDKKRISLRGAKTKYFHVKALSNGCYVLEPRVLVPPHAFHDFEFLRCEGERTEASTGLRRSRTHQARSNIQRRMEELWWSRFAVS